MTKFNALYEDARDAGYPHELETPRPMGPKDYQFVAENAGRGVGMPVLKFNGVILEGSHILQNNSRIFQYAHDEDEVNEIHIESVEMYRNLWNSIHIQKGNNMKSFKQIVEETGMYTDVEFFISESVNVKNIDPEWIKKSMIMSSVLKAKQKLEKVIITGNEDGKIAGFAVVKTNSKAKGDQFHRVEFGGTNNKMLNFNRPGAKGDLSHALGNGKGVEISFDSY